MEKQQKEQIVDAMMVLATTLPPGVAITFARHLHTAQPRMTIIQDGRVVDCVEFVQDNVGVWDVVEVER